MHDSSYGWLTDAIRDGAQIVTGNRRLARLLLTEYARRQAAAGKAAWRTPVIRALRDWVDDVLDATPTGSTPARLGTQQGLLVWERILRRELREPVASFGALVKQARDTWVALRAWNLSAEECLDAARGPDQRLFARAAIRYAAELADAGWMDEATSMSVLTALIDADRLEVPKRLIVVGFDRITPQTRSLFDTLARQGCEIVRQGVAERGAVYRTSYANPEAELRAAGRWARDQLESDPDRVVAVVVTHLERDADRAARLLREGMVPGWQWNDAAAAAVNVSYGRRLIEYPAIADAVLVLRWLGEPLDTRDISVLLRSRSVGTGPIAGRARLERRLRDLPDREWTPALTLRALERRDRDADDNVDNKIDEKIDDNGRPLEIGGDHGCQEPRGSDSFQLQQAAHGNDVADDLDWFKRLRRLAARVRELPRLASPSGWAETFDEILAIVGWPGIDPLDSKAFQLVTRWHDVLNELARLELVAATMPLDEAIRRLVNIVSETIFQPEVEGGVLNVIGPLEAAGMRFDRLWMTGMTAEHWPPAGRPLPLLARSLQREHGMPDADLLDTARFAAQVVARLLASADSIVCSYPRSHEGAEQMPTTLLDDFDPIDPPADPGWYAAVQAGATAVAEVETEAVPPVVTGERVRGGAATMQNQLSDPFTAFAYGRLGITRLPPIVHGVSAGLRGAIVHDALQALYRDLPDRDALSGWDAATVSRHTEAASRSAVARHLRHADGALRRLLELERVRTARLLAAVIAADLERPTFQVVAVEQEIEASIGGLSLRLRCDRVDRLADGSLVILDYKSGSRRRFLDSHEEPQDVQLVVYACAMRETVSALGLYNVDSRSVHINGAGSGFREFDDWEHRLQAWQAVVRSAASRFAAGDVRVNAWQSRDEARALNLLSRFGELVHE